MMILKIGGGRSVNVAGIAADLARFGESTIVVHGANAARDELAAALGKKRSEITSVSGYSSVLSDETTIDLMMMAYAGLQNKRIVGEFQRCGVNAVGLCGLDGRVIEGRRNRGIRVRENERTRLVRDLSGKPTTVNRPLLDLLLGGGYTPVLTMPILDENMEAINSENDDAVALLQRSFDASRVVMLVEAPGLMRDPNEPGSVIGSLLPEELASWTERTGGRMKRKLHALEKLFEQGSPTVVIADGRSDHPLAEALEGRGTVIRAAACCGVVS